jgi:hypothetical protein
MLTMRRLLLMFSALILLSQCKKPQFQEKDILVTGTARPVISLDGTWKFTMNPPVNFFRNDVSPEKWNNIRVPGECAMQGFAIKHNIPVVYKSSVVIPPDFSGKTIILRFEGVYSYARVWVNGTFIMDHSGGFTPWECDITQSVVPGSDAWITVEVTDKDNDLSYASGYAKHPIGGILRSVSIRALPGNFPSAIKVSTRFDTRYRDAELIINIEKETDKAAWAGFRMYDRNGNQVWLNDRRYRLRDDTSEFVFKIRNPDKWNAESPNLYTLIVEIFDRSILTASWKTRVGFRDIRVEGSKLLVNNEQVRLRGACRHDIHPLLGRVSTPEFDNLDVLLAKEANINFIRTSHYPPSESFLRYCDEYGIYVEDESAVCFVNTHRNRSYAAMKQSGPEFAGQQVSQLREMVEAHRNHPSVIIWSLGNESLYDEAFRMGYDYLKSADKSRPVIFSYPGTVPDSVKVYDLLSMHYPSWNGNLTQYGISTVNFSGPDMPVIFDEWAHVPCYNKPELLEDINVRNYWGLSIDSMWTNLSNSDGAGGAIWCMIDETFMMPDTMKGYNEWWGLQEESNGVKMYQGPVIGYGEWGIIDTWRRKKPEFWNTKKAYTPVKITIDNIPVFRPGGSLQIPVRNRFSHTNLKDVKTIWTYDGRSMSEKMRNIAPGESGEIVLPPSHWETGKTINLRFYLNDTVMIDEYNITLGPVNKSMPSLSPGDIKTAESANGDLQIESALFKLSFDRRAGVLRNLVIADDTLLYSGPWFHYRYPGSDHWSVLQILENDDSFVPASASYSTDNGLFRLSVKGTSRQISMNYSVIISPAGLFKVIYQLSGFPKNSRTEEIGLRFYTGPEFDSLNWDRKSYWSSYPPMHIGAASGGTRLDIANKNRYRQIPQGPWELDNKSFYYNGLKRSDNIPYLASALRENIYSYTLSTAGGRQLSVFSKGEHAARIRKKGDGYSLIIDKYWDYAGLGWGNYNKGLKAPAAVNDTLFLGIK